MKIGFIGLGNLGAPIAENLLEKGHQLFLYNRTPSKAQLLVSKGATMCNSVAEVAKPSEVLFSIVSDDAAINQITTGADGIAANLRPDAIHVSMSTISPATSAALHALHLKHQTHYLACPVMGRPDAARARKLNFLVSGGKGVIQKIKPLLTDAGAIGVWEIDGQVHAANVAKLCSNFLIAAAIEAMAEGIHLARKSGISADQWMNMLTQTIFNAPVYNNYGNILLKESFQPAGFQLRLGLKDVNLVLEQAEASHTEMPLASLLQHHLQTCVEIGLADHDWTAISLATAK